MSPAHAADPWPWIAVVVVVLIIAVSTTNRDDSGNTATNSTPPTATIAAPESVAAAETQPTAGIGSPVRDGKFEFVVTSIDRSKAAGDPGNEFLQETARGEFINVHLTVSNIGDRPQTFFSSNQKLIIDGKQFSASDALVLSVVEEINPEFSIDTTASFDVAPGSMPETIVLHDSALSGDVKVDLK